MTLTIVQALKALYVKCGGTDSNYNAETISEGLMLLKDVIVGADLPTVSGSDNGNVLKVVDGEWAAGSVVEAGSFAITMTVTTT